MSALYGLVIGIGNWIKGTGKEIVERRHGEPIKVLFLPKMGLLGSQAGNEKNAGCELWATFEGYFFMFSWVKIKSFENCRVRTKKLLDKKVKLKKKKN